jgi:ubiquinone/menaquinone biosynthesis C-methylase UbiE
MSLYDRAHFAIINLIHHTLYDLFVDPYPPLQAAGLRPGAAILEVGCGPGYFTIPAAKIVGESGHVTAVDTNEVAVTHVKRMVEAKELANTEVILADAAKTGLPDASFDIVFLFGVVHALDMTKVIPEMNRLLKAGGRMSVETHGTSEARLLESMESDGTFHLAQKSGRVYCFVKVREE